MNLLINLLPDTRQAKQRSAHRRQLMTGVAIAVWAVCGGVIVVLSLYTASQKLLLKNATADIQKKQAQLTATTGLIDALTAQQHLGSLSTLYGQRTYMTKFFDAYTESNPSDLTLASLAIDETNQLMVSGTAKGYAAVSKLARALEAEHVLIGNGAAPTNTPYFSNVTIQSANRASNQISFTIVATLASGVTSGK